MKKILLVGALSAVAVCAVAFSPGPEILFALAMIVLIIVGVAVFVHSPPTWLKTIFSTAVDDRLTGHGHISLAAGLGAGGHHGPPRSILFVRAVWALIVAVCSRVGHAVSNFFISAGHIMARTNTAAQPLPS